MDIESERINFNLAYIGKRNDILSLIPQDAKKILDVGCSIGTLGEQIKQKIKSVEVMGIELDDQMAQIAQKKIDKVVIGNVEEIDFKDHFSSNYFDCIIFADILEHLKNPWKVLKNISSFLNNGGVVIASIPNVRHYTTIISLAIKGYWPYRERGIHDKTHLRFFTLKNIKEMFQDAELKIVTIERNYRIIEKPSKYNKYSKYFALLFLKEFLAFQYLIVAKRG